MRDKEFIHGLSGLAPRHRGCVATIGSFDGVHRGHQNLLARLRLTAQMLRLPSLVMVFEPQPCEYFARGEVPARLMRLREKVQALFDCGVDRVLCLKFDSRLRGMSAREFIDQVLVEGLAVRHLQIGDDFRFGSDRQGDFALLQQVGSEQGFTVSSATTFSVDSERVSSTRIRQLLTAGDLSKACELLGAPYRVSGRVMHGNKLGRTIGVPTANISLGRLKPALQGVYAVRAREGYTAQGNDWLGVANIGTRPTLAGTKKPLLEVHLFNFNGNLYGRCLTVEFWHKIRPEQAFGSLEALQQQIRSDIASAEQYFTGQ